MKEKFIAINGKTISSDWYTKNEPYITNRANANTFYIVDTDLINHDHYVPDWLRENAPYIDYFSSFKYISKVHLVDYTYVIDKIVTKSINDFIKQINDNPGVNFFDFSYNYYLKFSIIDNELNIKRTVTFDKNTSCYSIPCLNSLFFSHLGNIDGDTNIDFISVIGKNGNSHIHIRITDGSNRIFTYNFSDDPTLAAADGSFYYL